MNLFNLRSLTRTTLLEEAAPPLKVALINARSVVNKTFLINNFFTTQDLDILFITETWIKPDELSPFTELVPYDCLFFNSPRLSGRGGGLASVFKKHYPCRGLMTSSYRTFEVQLMQPTSTNSLVFALVYRPPQPNKDFLNEFAEFVGDLVTRHDRILILGDFNIHVCCDSKPLSKEFLNLIASFDLEQWVSGHTHIQGHTLDLILSRGLLISDISIITTGMSDHFPILFSLPLNAATHKHHTCSWMTQILNDCAMEDFVALYPGLHTNQAMVPSLSSLDADNHLNFFNYFL